MPDVGASVFQIERRRRVIAACEKWWPLKGPRGLLNSADCSGFVISVARDLGITLNGQANDIFRALALPPWSILGTGDEAAHLAAVAATNGMFVVGVSQQMGGNGHVAVIVDTNYSSSKVPHRTRALAYWGALGSEGKQYALHSESWSRSTRPVVRYAAREITLG